MHHVFHVNQWKTPLSLAIALHVFALAATALAPSIFNRRPLLPEIYTVNLFNAIEAGEHLIPGKTPAARPKTSRVSTIRISSKPAVDKSQPAPPPKAISISPTKRKIKRAVAKKPKKVTTAKQVLLAQKIQQLRARLELKEASEKAAQAAKEAITKLRQSLRRQNSTTGGKKTSATTLNPPPGNGPAGSGVALDEITKQYYSAVYQRIHEHWILPDIQVWDDNLEAVLVIKIRRDGIVTNSFFENKSDNIYFNQFVMKTIRDAAPLPPFPPRLTKSFIEIGLRFRPGELL